MEKRKERKDRVPVGGARDVLTVPNKDPNYVYRWVLDIPGRLQRYEDGGYEAVREDLEIGQKTVDRSTQLGSVVTKHGGGLSKLVLMRIPKEWYDEDQASKMEKIDALEETMQAEAKEGRYGSMSVIKRK
jgi:hypothetical protein